MKRLTFLLLAILVISGYSYAQLSSGQQKYATAPIPVKTSLKTHANRSSGCNYLVLADNLPWGSNAVADILTAKGATFSTANSTDFPALDFEMYDVIIVLSDQKPAFHTVFVANFSKFVSFVTNGGSLEVHAATCGWNSPCGYSVLLPGGVNTVEQYDNFDVIVDPLHPIVAGMPNPFSGTYASHGYFANLVEGTDIITAAQSNSLPTTIQYKYGSGIVTATTCTYEYGYSLGQDCGTMLVNSLNYSCEHATALIITPSANPVCSSSSTQLTVSGYTGTVYWYTGGCNGTEINAGSNPLTVNPVSTTTYYVKDFVNGEFTGYCGSVTINVDASAPVAVAKTGGTVTLDPTGNYSLLPADVLSSWSDAGVGIQSVVMTPAAVHCADLGLKTVTVTVTDLCGNATIVHPQITVLEGTALPSPFASCIIGASNGTAIYTPCTGNGRFTLNSTGYSSTNSDVQESVTRSLSGNGSIVARVYDITGGGWAGVQIREDCGAGSKKVLLKTQLQTMLKADIRQTTGGATISTQIMRQGIKWLKLVRTGNRFDTYTSVDGIAWMSAYSTTLVMNTNVQIGIFSEGMSFSKTYQARFDNVVVTGATGGAAPVKTAETEIQPVNAQSSTRVEIYPNPAGKLVNVLISEPTTKASLNILSFEGKLVRSLQIDNTSSQIDVSTLKPGIYILRFVLDGAIISKQLVVQ